MGGGSYRLPPHRIMEDYWLPARAVPVLEPFVDAETAAACLGITLFRALRLLVWPVAPLLSFPADLSVRLVLLVPDKHPGVEESLSIGVMIRKCPRNGHLGSWPDLGPVRMLTHSRKCPPLDLKDLAAQKFGNRPLLPARQFLFWIL